MGNASGQREHVEGGSLAPLMVGQCGWREAVEGTGVARKPGWGRSPRQAGGRLNWTSVFSAPPVGHLGNPTQGLGNSPGLRPFLTGTTDGKWERRGRGKHPGGSQRDPPWKRPIISIIKQRGGLLNGATQEKLLLAGVGWLEGPEWRSHSWACRSASSGMEIHKEGQTGQRRKTERSECIQGGFRTKIRFPRVGCPTG